MKDIKKMVLTPIEDLIEEDFGKIGTPQRDAFEMECDPRLTLAEAAARAEAEQAGQTPEDAARQVLATLFGTTQFSVGLAWTPKNHKAMMAHWIRFVSDHADALRRGPFHPQHPEANYPVLTGESEGETVSVSYSPDFSVRIPADGRRHYVVNATGGDTVVVECEAEGKAVLRDTLGSVRDERSVVVGLHRMSIPSCGYLEFQPTHRK